MQAAIIVMLASRKDQMPRSTVLTVDHKKNEPSPSSHRRHKDSDERDVVKEWGREKASRGKECAGGGERAG